MSSWTEQQLQQAEINEAYEFGKNESKPTPTVGARCNSSFGDYMRICQVVEVNEEKQTYNVVADGTGEEMLNIPFSIWRPIIK